MTKLRSYRHTYMVGNNDGKTVALSSGKDSSPEPSWEWAVETVQGETDVIRLKNNISRMYLTAAGDYKVVQTKEKAPNAKQKWKKKKKISEKEEMLESGFFLRASNENELSIDQHQLQPSVEIPNGFRWYLEPVPSPLQPQGSYKIKK